MIRKFSLFLLLLTVCQFSLANKVFDDALVKAKLGDAQAQYNLGGMYVMGQGVAVDYKQAFYWLSKAAEQGNATAQCLIGVMYHESLGVAQDYEKAFYWLSKAAEQGNAIAQNNLGDMYEHGHGVKQDYKQAFNWYTKSAEQGTAIAFASLGNMYANGEGVTQDYKKAYEQHSIAILNGYAKGIEKRNEIAEKLSTQQLAEVKLEIAELQKNIEKNKISNK